MCDIVQPWVLVQSVRRAHVSRSSAARAVERARCGGWVGRWGRVVMMCGETHTGMHLERLEPARP